MVENRIPVPQQVESQDRHQEQTQHGSRQRTARLRYGHQYLGAPGTRHITVARQEGTDSYVLTRLDIEIAGDVRQPYILELARNLGKRLEQSADLAPDQRPDEQDQQTEEQER